MSLDTQRHHHATITAWLTRYGHDMTDRSAITWTQHGWRWTAHRRDGAWHIVGVDPNASPSSARPHTWVELCSRLSRMSAHDVTRHRPHEATPLVAPVQVEHRPHRDHGPLIPLDRFPNLGSVGQR